MGDRSARLDATSAAALLVGVITHSLFDVTLVPGLALLVLWALAAYLPGGIETTLFGMSAFTLRRWTAPLLWFAVIGLLAFPLPAARAAARAVAAVDQGNWAAAAAGYELAMRRDPALTAYIFDAAYVNAELALEGDDEALAHAIDLYRQGLARRPEYALHWANLAILEYHTGQIDAALADMRRASERAPDTAVFDELVEIMERGNESSAGEVPPALIGTGPTYSLNRYHVPGAGLELLPLLHREEDR
jgi:tetratricopeptide (TPR) repeat protein